MARIKLLCLFIFLFTPLMEISAQAPPDLFFHHPDTRLPYAHLNITLADGSEENIPFTSVIVENAPSGTVGLSRNIDLKGRITFAGNGIVAPDKKYNAFGPADISSRIVLIAYNVPDDYKKKYGEASDLHIRVKEAEERGALAVIIFGIPGDERWQHPLISIPVTEPAISIPVINLSFDNAMRLLNFGGLDFSNSGIRKIVRLPEFEPFDLPVVGRLKITGKFERVQSEGYDIQFLPGILTKETIQKYINDKKRAIKFITDLYQASTLLLPLDKRLFFPDYTSLYYYTGEPQLFESRATTVSVFKARPVVTHRTNYNKFVNDLTVPALMHEWGRSLPGLEISLANMTEYFSFSDNQYDNDIETAEKIIAKTLPSVVELFGELQSIEQFKANGLALAGGSFLGHLWKNYSRARLQKLFTETASLTSTGERISKFEEIYIKDFLATQREWLEILSLKHPIPAQTIEWYMMRTARAITEARQ